MNDDLEILDIGLFNKDKNSFASLLFSFDSNKSVVNVLTQLPSQVNQKNNF